MFWTLAKEFERAALAEVRAAGIDEGMLQAHLDACRHRRRLLRIELVRCGRHVALSVTTSPNERRDAHEVFHLLDLEYRVEADDWNVEGGC